MPAAKGSYCSNVDVEKEIPSNKKASSVLWLMRANDPAKSSIVIKKV
jgi:hypothetical protein